MVLKKRPLLLLHWFHHASVIAFAWASWVYATPLALWYGSMNFSVHAVMYSYFFATSFDRRVLRVAGPARAAVVPLVVPPVIAFLKQKQLYRNQVAIRLSLD